jgi:hypothetical protein
MHYQYNDGGRAAAGFKGNAGDCVVRALAIALNLNYKQLYKKLAKANGECGRARSARNGVSKEIYEVVLKQHGWRWFKAPQFDGRKARTTDMRKGVVICKQANHLVAVIDCVAQDIFDSSNRMVYGYYAKH